MKFIVFIVFLIPSIVIGQAPQVNTLKGDLYLTQNIYAIPLEGKTFPITASYHTTGMKVGETGGSIGVGWKLNIEGAIYRKLNNYPDDELLINGDKKGWLFEQQTEALSTAYDVLGTQQNFSGSDDVSSHQFEMNSNILKDVPDEFIVDFMGISGTIIFDNAGVPHFQQYNGCSIEVEYELVIIDGGVSRPAGPIKSFKIIDAEGYSYLFAEKDITHQIATNEKDFGKNVIPDPDLRISQAASYVNSWNLSEITSPAGEQIIYHYRNDEIESEFESPKYKLRESAFSKLIFEPSSPANEYSQESTIIQGSTSSYIQRIDVLSINNEVQQRIVFEGWVNRNLSGVTNASNFDINNFALNAGRRTERLGHLKVYASNFGRDILQHNFKFNYYASRLGKGFYLKSITDVKSGQYLQPTEYDYYSIHNSSIKVGNREKDNWGYFNDSGVIDEAPPTPPQAYVFMELLDNNRSTSLSAYNLYYRLSRPVRTLNGDLVVELEGEGEYNPEKLHIGCLKSVSQRKGAFIEIEYEPNLYYDEALNQNLYGGGVRVKAMTEFVHKDDAEVDISTLTYKPQVKEYTYADEEGRSYGRIVNYPNYILPQQYYLDPDTEEKKLFTEVMAEQGEVKDIEEAIKLFVKRSNYDLDLNSSNYIVYGKVTEAQNELSFLTYEYDNLGTIGGGDQTYFSNPVGRFYQFDYAANPSFQPLGLLKSNIEHGYTYVPRYNESIYNGLLKTVLLQNKEGKTLEKTSYTYQFIGNELVDAIELFQVKQHNSNSNLIYSLGKYNIYLGLNRSASEIKRETFDEVGGQLFKSATQKAYFDDYLFLLKSSEMESEGKIKRKYFQYANDFSIGDPSSFQQGSAGEAIWEMQAKGMKTARIGSYSSFDSGDGVEHITDGGLSLFTIKGGYILPLKSLSFSEILDRPLNEPTISADGTFVADNVYTPKRINSTFDRDRFLSTTNIQGSQVNSAIWDHDRQLPILTASKCSAEEIIYTDFDAESAFQFTHELTKKRLQQNRFVELASGVPAIFSGTLTTNQLPYELSFQYQADVATSVNIIIENEVGAALQNLSINLKANTNWQLASLMFDLNYTGEITIEITPNNLIAVDELMLRPEKSIVQTMGYDYNRRLIRQTNTDGQKTFYEYDKFGRLLVVRDDALDILKVNKYSEQPLNVFSADFSITDVTKPSDPDNLKYKVSADINDNQVSYYWTINNNEEYLGSNIEIIDVGFFVAPYRITLRAVHAVYGEQSNTLTLDTAL